MTRRARQAVEGVRDAKHSLLLVSLGGRHAADEALPACATPQSLNDPSCSTDGIIGTALVHGLTCITQKGSHDAEIRGSEHPGVHVGKAALLEHSMPGRS